jgi:hypothetical protein
MSIFHYNFGIRKFNIIHCQLINEASNLKTHLFNDFLSDNTKSYSERDKTIIKRTCSGKWWMECIIFIS